MTHGSTPDEFVVSSTGEMDPFVSVTPERVKELTRLGKEAVAEEWSVLRIMQAVFAAHTEGMAFMQLWAEVNVVRRTTRRVVASNLLSYHVFTQRPAGADHWLYDERKLTQGRKKTKRRFIRR
jgi:hypothetical protein